MTRTTPAEHSLMSSGGDSIKRGLVMGTRDSFWQATVSAVHQDADTNGIFSLDLTSITGGNDPTNCYPGMSLDVGTTAGARDIGTVRIRFYNSDANTVTIAETAPADLPVEVGHFVTARLEFLPFKIPKRIVLTRDMSGNITAVTEYLDYDLAYSDGSAPFSPKGNITAGHNVDGSPKHIRHFGWVDTGQTYRTLHLSALDSVMHNPGSTLDIVLWDVGDGVYTGGGLPSDTEIDIQFPIGFRYIHLKVQDSTGRGDLFWRHMPIWVDDPNNPQFVLRNFNVTTDETEAGREMQFEFFGDENEADESIIPPFRPLVCYFEEPEWTDGDTVPESYRTEFVGWVSDDDPLLKLEASKYGIKVGGTQHWKQSFRANSVTFIDKGTTPTTYTEMEDITIDRVLDFSLIATDSLRSLVNVYYGGYQGQVEAITLPLGDAWSQLTETAPRGAMCAVGCDSLGNIFIRRQYSYLPTDVRPVVLEAMSATNADWQDQDGLDLPTTKISRVGLVDASAELWDSGDRILYASRAPGLREGYGTGNSKLPDQYLQLPTPQANLNDLAGKHYFHEINPIPTVSLVLFGNLDVIEPCWQQPILVTWLDDTIRDTQLDNAPFMVKHISTQHTNSPDANNPPKKITLTLEAVTDGEPGETAPVLQMEGVTQIADTTCAVTAGFSSSVDVCLATFTDTSTGDLIFAWLWDFGDGSSPSSEQNPVHGFAVAGTYTVTLWVASDCGVSDPVSHNVSISAETVAPAFTFADGGLTVDFTDTSTADSDIIAWTWDFGDGGTSAAQNPSYTYAAHAGYTVTLTVTTACGNSESTTRDISTAEAAADHCRLIDLTASNGGFIASEGTYVPGTGWRATNVTTGHGIFLSMMLIPDVKITQLEIEGFVTWVGGGMNARSLLADAFNGGSVSSNSQDTNTLSFTHTWTADVEPVDQILVQLFKFAGAANSSNLLQITSVKISYHGTQHFISDNC